MNPDEEALAIAARIADGSGIDWRTADATPADATKRGVLNQLKAISSLADLHREWAAAPDADAAPALMQWGPLTLIGTIGEGQFGRVYRAWDPRLQRQVALKLLHAASPETASSPTRAIEEARMLAQVRHPNVLTVHGAESIGGQVGIWTEFIDGCTLESLIVGRDPLPAADVIAIGIDLSRALAAVHEAGLLHRDVKAQNVMRETGGRIVLMDFGTGHDMVRAPAREGDLSGTPLYLAPELFAGGQPSVASDIYALAVLLFYLSIGKHPVPGRTLDDVRSGHTARRTASLGDVRSDLPGELAAAIERGLVASPSARYESARAFEAALEGLRSTPIDVRSAPPAWWESRRMAAMLTLGVSAAAIAVIGWAFNIGGWAAGPAPGSTASLAAFDRQDTVLIAAFDNHTGDPSLDGALERALSYELSQSPHVAVASTQRRDDLLRLMGKAPETVVDRSVAREMALRDGNIRLVLAGKAEKPGNTYVLTVQALDPLKDTRVHSLMETAELPADIVPAIRRLATRLRSGLGEPKANPDLAAGQTEGVTTPSLQALRLYSEAYDAGTRGWWPQSESLVRSALDLDPDFAPALNWLGWSLLRQNKPYETCLPYFERAFRLSKTTPDRERYFIAGSYFGFIGDSERAIASYDALVRLYPDHFWGVNNLINGLNRSGRRLETSDLLADLAQRRPGDIRLVERAAMETLAAKGIKAARPHVAQALSLSRRRGPEMLLLWVELFDAHEEWLAGRPDGAARRLEAAMASGVVGQANEPTRVAAGYFYLALGRAGAAAAAFEGISDPVVRSLGLGAVALARGQSSEVSRQLGAYGGRDGASALILLHAGDRARAQDLLNRILLNRILERVGPMLGEPGWDAIRAEVDATLPVSAKLVALTRAVEHPFGWDTARYYLHVETLASLLQESGSSDAALKVLQRAASYKERAHKDPNHIGYFWMRVQKRLADAYRAAGKRSEAEMIEAELLRLLSTADQDFPLLLELRARSLAAQRP